VKIRLPHDNNHEGPFLLDIKMLIKQLKVCKNIISYLIGDVTQNADKINVCTKSGYTNIYRQFVYFLSMGTFNIFCFCGYVKLQNKTIGNVNRIYIKTSLASDNLIKIRSTHLLPIFYRVFLVAARVQLSVLI
jgi:hypothetical protein